jgi:hypothetical protein
MQVSYDRTCFLLCSSVTAVWLASLVPSHYDQGRPSSTVVQTGPSIGRSSFRFMYVMALDGGQKNIEL